MHTKEQVQMRYCINFGKVSVNVSTKAVITKTAESIPQIAIIKNHISPNTWGRSSRDNISGTTANKMS